MIQCKICNEKSRRKTDALEHYERFHQPPKLNDDGTIQINATHQVTLILKGNKTWEQVLKEEHQRSKKFKRTDESAFRSIEQLRKFEVDNNMEFGYCNNEFFIERAQLKFGTVN